MAGILLSGPAGAGKSQLARAILRAWAREGRLAVAADFQSIVAALTLAVRGEDGKFPERDDRLLPMAEHIRREVIDAARARGISVVATNSDGAPQRRQALLERIGDGATERVVDPGRSVVEGRLADPLTGDVSPACQRAVGRWYDRLPGAAG